MEDISAITNAIQRDITGDTLKRLGRVAVFYGYGQTGKLVEFITVFAKEHESMFDVEKTVAKWNAVTTIRNTLGALKRVYEVPEIVRMLGADVCNKTNDRISAFIKSCVEKIGNGAQQKTTLKKNKHQKDDDNSSQQSIKSTQSDPCSDGFEGESDPQTYITIKPADMNDLRNRLLMYCDMLKDIEEPVVKTILKCIKFDIDRYLDHF